MTTEDDTGSNTDTGARTITTRRTSRTALGAAPDKRLIVSLALNLVITLLQGRRHHRQQPGAPVRCPHTTQRRGRPGTELWAVRLSGAAAPPPNLRNKGPRILVALFNSAVWWASPYTGHRGGRRLLDPRAGGGPGVIGFAAGGLVIKHVAAVLLRSHGHDLNLRAAFLHLIGDAATTSASAERCPGCTSPTGATPIPWCPSWCRCGSATRPCASSGRP
jgi:hypothetical protein